MKKVEIVTVLIILLSSILKLLLVDFSNHLLLISCSLLSILYFAFSFAILNNIGFRDLFKTNALHGISAGRIVGSIGLGITLSIVIIGAQFKLLLLEGAEQMLTVGNTLLVIILAVALLVLFVKYKGKAPHFYKNVFKRIIPGLVAGLLLLNVSAPTLIDIYYRDNPKYAQLLKKVMDNPKDEELWKELQKERENLK